MGLPHFDAGSQWVPLDPLLRKDRTDRRERRKLVVRELWLARHGESVGNVAASQADAAGAAGEAVGGDSFDAAGRSRSATLSPAAGTVCLSAAGDGGAVRDVPRGYP